MTDTKQKEVFARNLNRLLARNHKTQKEVADAIGVLTTTFNTWCTGVALPRMGKVQLLADYFGVLKSDLIEDKPNATGLRLRPHPRIRPCRSRRAHRCKSG